MATKKKVNLKAELLQLMAAVDVAKWAVEKHLAKMYPKGSTLYYNVRTKQLTPSSGVVTNHKWNDAMAAPFIRVTAGYGYRDVSLTKITGTSFTEAKIKAPLSLKKTKALLQDRVTEAPQSKKPWSAVDPATGATVPLQAKKAGKKLTVAAVIAERAPTPVPVFDRTKAALLQPVKKVAPAFKTARTGKK